MTKVIMANINPNNIAVKTTPTNGIVAEPIDIPNKKNITNTIMLMLLLFQFLNYPYTYRF